MDNSLAPNLKSDVIAGKHIQHQCSTTPTQNITALQWLKNSEPVTNTSRLTTYPDGKMEIREVVGTDSGTYSCVASDVFGQSCTVSLHLKVYGKLKVVIEIFDLSQQR